MLPPRPVAHSILRQIYVRQIARDAWRMAPCVWRRIRASHIELEAVPIEPEDLGRVAALAARRRRRGSMMRPLPRARG